MANAWYLQLVGTFLHLFVGERDLGRLAGMKACKTANMIKMMLASHVLKRLELKSFKRQANDLCLAAPVACSNFIQYWERHAEFEGNTTAGFNDSFGSSSDSGAESAAVSDDSDAIPSKKPSANSHEDTMLMEYSIGTVNIHINNLVPPHPSRTTRMLDHRHVGNLIESFTESEFRQLVILQGMLRDVTVRPDNLDEEGGGEVEVLGGNHTREALQTLRRKGMLRSPMIRVNLFTPLPRPLALRIGYEHNSILHEKKKPVSFMDKVRLMRECRPNEVMSAKQTQEWRDSLVTIFGVKDRRKLQQSYGLHLSMAVLKSELWAKLTLAADKITITEKFFRGLARLHLDEDKGACLDVLLAKGATAFKQKVKGFIDAGHVKSKMKVKKRKEGETAHELLDENPDDPLDIHQEERSQDEGQSDESWAEKYKQLMEKYKALEQENLDLRETVKELSGKENGQTEEVNVPSDTAEKELKRRRVTKNMFAKGDKVMAFWRDESTGEETWQEATVLFSYTDDCSFPEPNFANVELHDNKTTLNETAIIKCWTGYTPSVKTSVTCLSNGTWEKWPECELAGLSSNPKETTNIGVIVGVGVGSAVVTLLIVVIVSVTKRCIRTKSQRHHEQKQPENLPDVRTGNEQIMLEQISSAATNSPVFLNETPETEHYYETPNPLYEELQERAMSRSYEGRNQRRRNSDNTYSEIDTSLQ